MRTLWYSYQCIFNCGQQFYCGQIVQFNKIKPTCLHYGSLGNFKYETRAFQVFGADSSHSLQVVQWCTWIESKVKGIGQRVLHNRYVLVLEVRSMQKAQRVLHNRYVLVLEVRRCSSRVALTIEQLPQHANRPTWCGIACTLTLHNRTKQHA
jgi:hypothetical protein